MAGTIKITGSIQIENGSFKKTLPQAGGSINVTQDGSHFHGTIVDVGTSEEDMPIGDVATEGWLYLRNLSSLYYVTWGPKSGGSMVAIGKLEPGEEARFRMDSSATLRWVATGGTAQVEMGLAED
jgi:hypothetical protein